MVEGQVQEGGGIFFLAFPAFAVTRSGLVVSAGSSYQIELLDFEGEIITTIHKKAPKPIITESIKKYVWVENLKNMAVSRILSFDDDLLIISNYFRENKPRVDRFSRAGKLKKSYLLPLEFDYPAKTVTIQNDLLIYIDREQSGFKAYRMNL